MIKCPSRFTVKHHKCGFLFCPFRYHLQAFRHLYVLAAEPRVLVPREVDTNKACHVPLEVTLKVGARLFTFSRVIIMHNYYYNEVFLTRQSLCELSLGARRSSLNPSSPNINMQILLTVLHVFLMALAGRICLNINIKTFPL